MVFYLFLFFQFGHREISIIIIIIMDYSEHNRECVISLCVLYTSSIPL